MDVIGVIAEYNPFHNGHLYHIKEIKRMYPNSIIVAVISTSFLQRGEVSILNKWDKTRICLENGIDLVIELPFVFSSQSADVFSYGALKILNYLNVNKLVFGSESNDIKLLYNLAKEQLNNKSYDKKVKKYLDEGYNYPTAMSKALSSKVSSPNDLLAISYIKQIIKNNYKNLKSGNNMSNKNLKEIEEYILSIRSYNAKIEVEIQSNKNKNKYVLEQKYAEPNVQKQIVLEPSNIEGLETIFDGNNLKINNTKLNLSTVYENYSDVTSNFLWLNTFTEEYKKMIETGKQNIIEQNGIIIMEIKDADELNKKLYIDRKTGKPIKMQIKNVSKNTTVYILYNEIEINSLKRDDVLAFRLKNVYVNM